jgi:UDP:flavonoid glycosyltransferase YjiC (YdhE family)
MGLGLALKARGHRVTLIASGYFAEIADHVGLDFVDKFSKEEFLQLVDDPQLWHPLLAVRSVFGKGVAPYVARQYEAIAERRGPRTIVVTSCLGLGARIAQDHLGIPLVTAHLQPAVIWSNLAPPVVFGMLRGRFVPRWVPRAQFWVGRRFVLNPLALPPVNALRQKLALEPVRDLTSWWASPDCILALFPAWFAPPQPDWPPQIHCTEFPLWDPPLADHPSLSPNCRAFLDGGDPPIVFTGGTANMFARELFAEALEVCQRLDRRAILVSRFPETIPAHLPDDILTVAYEPFSALLPRAAAVVHHGGVGTTSRALATGTPQLVMPLAHDQLDNAIRVAELGVAAWYPGRRPRAATMSQRLRQLMEAPGVSTACGRISARMSSADPFQKACQVIEAYGGSCYGMR